MSSSVFGKHLQCPNRKFEVVRCESICLFAQVFFVIMIFFLVSQITMYQSMSLCIQIAAKLTTLIKSQQLLTYGFIPRHMCRSMTYIKSVSCCMMMKKYWTSSQAVTGWMKRNLTNPIQLGCLSEKEIRIHSSQNEIICLQLLGM